MGHLRKRLQRLISKKKDRTNPIIDNRIVSDITFATRFRSFVYDFLPMDPIQEEEAEYLRMVADKLLLYQRSTVTDQEELDYFKNLKK